MSGWRLLMEQDAVADAAVALHWYMREKEWIRYAL
jgi:hypothetical protein